MTDIHIPPEAVEAAVRTHMNLNLATRERAMDAAIRAALENWPGVWQQRITSPTLNRPYSIILPLTEPRDE